jgi:hypothetical protein
MAENSGNYSAALKILRMCSHFWKSFSGKANASNVHLRWKKGQQMFWVLLKAFPYYGGNIKQHSHFPSFYSNFDVENGR